jgi:hypothetical protein
MPDSLLSLRPDSPRQVEHRRRQYNRDTLFFLISFFIAMGWPELQLVPQASVAHPIIGWVLWAIPVFVGCHMLWIYFASKGRSVFWRVVYVVTIGIVFTALAVLSVRMFITEKAEAKIRDEQRDTFDNLHIAQRVPNGALQNTIFTVVNDGHAPILVSESSCVINLLVFTGGGVLERSMTSNVSPKSKLEGGGDGESFQCFGRLIRTPDNIVRCADIVITFPYVLEDRPAYHKTKEWRLMALGDDPREWFQEPLNPTFGGHSCQPYILH